MTELDNPAGCVQELAEVNREVGEFGHLWASAAGQLKELEGRRDRLHRAALRSLASTDLKVAEKDATAHAAVEQTEPGLAEKIEALEGKVEEYRILFRALERRSSNAQSILSALKTEAKMGDHITEPAWTS